MFRIVLSKIDYVLIERFREFKVFGTFYELYSFFVCTPFRLPLHMHLHNLTFSCRSRRANYRVWKCVPVSKCVLEIFYMNCYKNLECKVRSLYYNLFHLVLHHNRITWSWQKLWNWRVEIWLNYNNLEFNEK